MLYSKHSRSCVQCASDHKLFKCSERCIFSFVGPEEFGKRLSDLAVRSVKHTFGSEHRKLVGNLGNHDARRHGASVD